MLSIVIPTKNEEKFLPRLLWSLSLQSFRDFEVIVADANSSDGTRGVARSFGARVVSGGLPGVGRNRGARVALGDVLLFLDADVVLHPEFLMHNMTKFVKKRLNFATTTLRPLSSRVDDKVLHAGLNVALFGLKFVHPQAFGFTIFVEKKWFDRSGGFDESVVWGEEGDLCSRLAKFGARFDVLRGCPVHVSVRRLDKEGRLGAVWKCVRGMSYMWTRGPIKKPIFEYEWGYSADSRKRKAF